MTRYTKYLLTLPAYFLSTKVASAACPANQYELLAPIGTLSGCVDLAGYLKGILETTIGIAGILAVIMIVICGIQLMASGSAGGKSAAKECITNAIFGVLLAIGSWLLLNTINPLLLKSTQTLPNIAVLVTPPAAGPTTAPFPTEAGWYFRYREASGNIRNSQPFGSRDQCDAVLQQTKTTPGVSIENTPAPSAVNLSKTPAAPECWQVLAGSTPLTGDEKAARQSLCGNDSCVNQSPIGINRPACRYHGDQSSCTNVGGLQPAAITAIKNLQTACGCNVLITGGTEDWFHAAAGTGSHAPGNGVFDLRWDGATSPLSNTIKSQNPQKDSFAGNKRWLYNGFWYTDEASAKTRHWHVCPNGATPFYCK